MTSLRDDMDMSKATAPDLGSRPRFAILREVTGRSELYTIQCCGQTPRPQIQCEDVHGLGTVCKAVELPCPQDAWRMAAQQS